ncbi:uncharacterized protein LOC106522286 [Austrofundulus limnaeus]|uniref:Uncharacterized protein LOC106522286 n=1 Tax=Austrofundulus limnaeus TaxID=52670 RepID=A0A2I4BSH1_AUSLI|nr:PREDICTED: uncharacterized protein LOC106522286 [Austrofundulus limnaeus]
MAPVYVAGRLSLSILVISLLFLSFGTSEIKSLLVYDRQTLLDLRHPVNKVSTSATWKHNIFPELSGYPAHLYQTPVLPSRRKRHRRRGKRGGRLVRLRVCLSRSKCFRTVPVMFTSVFVPLRFLEPVDPCLIHVVGGDVPQRNRRLCLPRLSKRGVNPQNLKSLSRAQRDNPAPAPARIGLVNARSLVNKTFILRDFFISNKLDFLCITETWLKLNQLLCRSFYHQAAVILILLENRAGDVELQWCIKMFLVVNNVLKNVNSPASN